MKTTTKYLSREAAIENVKRFFSNTSEDAITIEDAFTAWGRDLTQAEKNKGWFSNKMVDLKYHNLVSPIYTNRNNRRTLVKIQLSLDGKRALGRAGLEVPVAENDNLATTTNHNNKIELKDVMDMIAKLKDQYKDFDISFDVKLKSG